MPRKQKLENRNCIDTLSSCATALQHTLRTKMIKLSETVFDQIVAMTNAPWGLKLLCKISH